MVKLIHSSALFDDPGACDSQELNPDLSDFNPGRYEYSQGA